MLVGVERLMKDLTESHVTLQAMFQSRHAFEVKSDAEIWSDSLSQARWCFVIQIKNTMIIIFDY